jgi:hypothetical protein
MLINLWLKNIHKTVPLCNKLWLRLYKNVYSFIFTLCPESIHCTAGSLSALLFQYSSSSKGFSFYAPLENLGIYISLTNNQTTFNGYLKDFELDFVLESLDV